MKFYFLGAMLLLTTTAGLAQGFRLNGYAMYTFDDAVDSYYSNSRYFEGKIKGGLTWGVGAEFMLKPEYGLELLYLRQDTEAPITYAATGGVKSEILDVSINYIMLGGVRYLKANPKVEPYGGILLGMGIINTEGRTNTSSQDVTKFAFGFRGGANFWATERFGIKLQVLFMSVPQAIGGGLYFGTGGAGAGVNSYSSMLQLSLGGGVCLKLGS